MVILTNKIEKEQIISIVVPVYSNERFYDICELLESIYNQKYLYVEVICVVGKSRELFNRLTDYARDNIKGKINLVFNDGDYKLNVQRNIGIENAHGSIVAFLDDDAVLSPEWAFGVVQAFEDPNIIGITGPIVPLWESEDLSWLPKEFWWAIACTGCFDVSNSEELRNVWGGNMAFRKEAFEIAGNFNPAISLRGKQGLVIGEVEMSLRIRETTQKKIVFVSKMMIKHKVKRYRTSFRFLSQRAYSVGKSRIFIREMFKESKVGKNILKPETDLLKRILIRLVPEMTLNLIIKPLKGLKQLFYTIVVLTYTGIGFATAYSYSIFKKSNLRI